MFEYALDVKFALQKLLTTDQTASAVDPSAKGRSFVLLIADLSPVYAATMLGVVLHGSILVPIHGALDVNVVSEIISRTSPAACVIDSKYSDKLKEAIKLAHVTCVQVIVSFPKNMESVKALTPPTEEVASGNLGDMKDIDVRHFFAVGRKARANIDIKDIKVICLIIVQVTQMLFADSSISARRHCCYSLHKRKHWSPKGSHFHRIACHSI